MTTETPDDVAALCAVTPSVTVLDNRGLAGEARDTRIEQQGYGARGQLLSSLDPRRFSEQQLDPLVVPNFRYQSSLSGQALRTQSQDAGDLVALHDVAGGLRWQQAARGQVRRCDYDVLHRLSTVAEQDSPTSPERISERFVYGEAEPQASAANSRGQLRAHYDTAGLHQVPRYRLGGQPLQSVRQLLLDPEASSDWQGTEAHWQAQLESTAYSSRMSYNALGAVIVTLDAKGNRQRQQFNVAGQLAGSGLTLAGHSSERPLLHAVQYSAAGQVWREEGGNGVVSDYHYEAQTQRLSRLTTKRPAQSGRTALLQDLSYRYDPVGNILEIADAAQSIRYHRNQRIEAANLYGYDALYQLLSATGRENATAGPQGPGLPSPQIPISSDANAYSSYRRDYRYDRGGNLIQMRHQGRHNYTQDLVVAPASNRAVPQTGFLTPADVDGYFDAAGNLQQLAPGQPLQWNGRNQLQRVVQVQRPAAADDAESYQYDGQGQRLRKSSVSHTSGSVHTAQVIYLPGLELRRHSRQQHGSPDLVEELQVIQASNAGRQQVRVLHWDVGQPADLPNDQVRASLDNQIGSSLLELDQAADLLTLEEYFPYGGTAVWSGQTAAETQYKFVRYSGKERDATGLYYYGFRYYAPWLGRWLNPDPAGTVDGLNLYRMVQK